jgi:murein L,D-transpeptidase YcbB/YkuD
MTKKTFLPSMLPVLAVILTLSVLLPAPASALVTAFRQAIAEGVAEHEDMAEFYRERAFEPIWTRTEDAARRNALLMALEGAANHGLPAGRYDPDALRAAFMDADNPYNRGQAEIMASAMFLRYAHDVQSGILDPGEIVREIHRDLPRRDPTDLLQSLVDADPYEVMRALPPAHPEYLRLQRELLRLTRMANEGGWGASVYGGRLELGDRGQSVVQLRDRLIRMGYMERSATAVFDADMEAAVQRFQSAHGLLADGVAGASTIEEVNIGLDTRLRQVILAMERQRWMNWEDPERGSRHVLVNIPDYHAYVIDNEEVTFETRVVVGATPSNRVTPEFSDTMEHMVINPSWYVPRSITIGEYLPQMQANPAAAGHLDLLQGGRQVSRAGIDFSQYTASTFPFDLRQGPGPSNALGRVKFMFPNRHNIYLHDTPSRNLFARETRAYSHGCVRVHRPLELAYHLLARQESQPQSYFDRILHSGQETQVDLVQQIPVHIVYWTAFVTPEGELNFRRDIYGRDRALWNAMEQAGVELPIVAS